MVTKSSAFEDAKDAFMGDQMHKTGEKPEVARANAIIEGRLPNYEMTTAAAVSAPGNVGTANAACAKCKKNPCVCKAEAVDIQVVIQLLKDGINAKDWNKVHEAYMHLLTKGK